jgi:hypothetical protein
MKENDISARLTGELTAIVWQNKRDVYMLHNNYPEEGNFGIK